MGRICNVPASTALAFRGHPRCAALYVESFATTGHFADGNKRVGFVLDVANKAMSVEQ
jgi:hypothetical protein